jgi:hypothetical protein
MWRHIIGGYVPSVSDEYTASMFRLEEREWDPKHWYPTIKLHGITHQKTVTTTRTVFPCTTRLPGVGCGTGRTRHGAMFFRTCETSCSTGSLRAGCGVQCAKPDTGSRWRRCLKCCGCVGDTESWIVYTSSHNLIYSYTKLQTLLTSYMSPPFCNICISMKLMLIVLIANNDKFLYWT